RLPCFEAFRPAAGTAGPAADPRRAAAAGEGGFRPHTHGDGSEPHQAVCRADGHRRRHARVLRRRHRRPGRHCRGSERHRREYWRTPTADGDGTGAGRYFLPRAGPQRHDDPGRRRLRQGTRWRPGEEHRPVALHPVGSAACNCSAGAALHGKTGRDCGAREAPAGLSPLNARQVSTRLRARHNLRPTSTGRRMRRIRSLFLGLLLAVTASAGQAAVLVPPGNRNAVQPAIPGASVNRTQATNTTFQAKYRKVYALLKNDGRLRAKIKETAAAYAIDPIHIVGAIVGEHTYNVDAYDRLQTYYVKAISYLSSRF